MVVVNEPLSILRLDVMLGEKIEGDNDRTTVPDPVDADAPVPPLVTGNVPEVIAAADIELKAPIVLLVRTSVVSRPTRVVVAAGIVIALAPLTMDENDGVVSDGDVPNTSAPVPVSSLITPASWADVVAANWLSGSAVSASPAAAAVHDKLPAPSVLRR
jgi:hypothetical protein